MDSLKLFFIVFCSLDDEIGDSGLRPLSDALKINSTVISLHLEDYNSFNNPVYHAFL